MLYLATPSSPATVTAMGAGLLGLIDTPWQGGIRVREAHAHGTPWAADNGAFTDRWTADTWWSWITKPAQLDHAHQALFATAPDVVADAAATWERSRPWLPKIRALGYPVAYVGQDGLTELPWDDFDVLFLGGSTEWKLGQEARDWTAAAVARGVHVHMGRVNSEKRWRYAQAIGCSSVDGTFLAFGPDKLLPRLLTWNRNLEQGALF